jgi:hypothetical protein
VAFIFNHSSLYLLNICISHVKNKKTLLICAEPCVFLPLAYVFFAAFREKNIGVKIRLVRVPVGRTQLLLVAFKWVNAMSKKPKALK